MLWCTCMMMGTAIYVVTHWILVPIMFTVLLMLLSIMITCPCPLVVLRMMSRMTPHSYLVQVMKDDGEIVHGLARGEWGGVLTMRSRYMGRDTIRLHPNGTVSYVPMDYCFWRPIDENLQVQMQLTHDVVNWHLVGQMSWSDRYDEYTKRRLNITQQ